MLHTPKRRQPRNQFSPGYAGLLAEVIAELGERFVKRGMCPRCGHEHKWLGTDGVCKECHHYI